MKQLLFLFIVLSPIFNAYSMETQNDWRKHHELLRSNDSSTMSLDSEIEAYDLSNTCAPSGAIVLNSQNEPFKSAYGDTADLNNLRHLTVLFHPNNASLPAVHSDDESYSDETYDL